MFIKNTNYSPWNLLLFLLLAGCVPARQSIVAQPADYLDSLKLELTKTWPQNRTINLVFHGHSVPAGYFKTPIVNTLESYPYLLLKQLKVLYPHAVINIINTAIGGENSKEGSKRFKSEVLCHHPDLLFLDYSLNDRRVGLAEAHDAWSKMIRQALEQDIKIILLTPSPDQKVDLLLDDSDLTKHQHQVRQLSQDFGIGLVDSYALFKEKVEHGVKLTDFMSQSNHPNTAGHSLIADQILKFFQ